MHFTLTLIFIAIVLIVSTNFKPKNDISPTFQRKKQIMGSSSRRVMHRIDSLGLFLHAAFFDDRKSNTLRVFGIQRKENLFKGIKYYCVVDIGQQMNRVIGKKIIIDQWPEWSKALAIQIECNVTKPVTKVQLEMVTKGGDIFIVHMPIEESERPNPDEGQRDLAVCIKCVHGKFPPERLVEWIETLTIAGVQQFFIYDGGLDVSSRFVFDYYDSSTVVTDFPFGEAVNRASSYLFNIDAEERYSLQEHVNILAFNDCLYRHYKQYKFFMIIDLDEMILPAKGISIVKMIKTLESIDNRRAGFIFPTSWHFEEMGFIKDTPKHLYFQKYAKSGIPIDVQAKSIISSKYAELIQWHEVAKPFIKSSVVSWTKYGSTHHFRGKCSSKFTEQYCEKVLNESYYIQSTITKYRDLIEDPVKNVLKQLQLIDV